MDANEIKSFIDLLVRIELSALFIIVIQFIFGENPTLFVVIAVIVSCALSIINLIEGNFVSGLLWALPPAIFYSALSE